MSLASAQLLSTVQARAAHAPKGLAFPCCPGTNTKLRKKPPPLPPWMQWAAVSTRSLPTLLSTVPEHSPGPSGVSTNSLPVVAAGARPYAPDQTSPVESRSEEHTSELQSHHDLVCRLLLEKKKKNKTNNKYTTNKNNITYN